MESDGAFVIVDDNPIDRLARGAVVRSFY